MRVNKFDEVQSISGILSDAGVKHKMTEFLFRVG